MSRAIISQDLRESLLKAAHEAMQHAYAPYSNFHVGAALLTSDGRVFQGCNVENASYGLTICAERNAIFTAVASSDNKTKLTIQAIAVCNSKNAPCSPCGACRQVIAEFGKDAVVFYEAPDGIREKSMTDLLPDCFSL